MLASSINVLLSNGSKITSQNLAVTPRTSPSSASRLEAAPSCTRSLPTEAPMERFLFQKALIQSPGIGPKENDDGRNVEYADFLKLAGVSNVAQARQLSFTAVYAANVKQIYAAPYGQFVYGTSVDGTFAPDLAAKLLLNGKFDKSVAVTVGHNVNEVWWIIVVALKGADEASHRASASRIHSSRMIRTSSRSLPAGSQLVLPRRTISTSSPITCTQQHSTEVKATQIKSVERTRH